MEEIWKDIPDYNGVYQVSNLGRLRSTDRVIIRSNGTNFTLKGKMLKLFKDGRGYLGTYLSKNTVAKYHKIHRLVMAAFCGKSDLNVDHINNDKNDNRLDNLRYCTQRENSTFGNYSKRTKKTSNYTGVGFCKRSNKWKARYFYNGKDILIGRFEDELSAAVAYKETIKKLQS